MSKIEIKIEKDFNLDHIFDCGQCFRWTKNQDESYTGVAFARAVTMAYENGILTIDGGMEEDLELWADYLDLETDYNEIKKSLDIDPKIIEYGEGIRILNQDPWETLVSFIISQNNNIPRIKGCIEKMCRLFGKSLGVYKGEERFAFPDAETLAGLALEDLSPVKLGYRAGYILDTAKKVFEEGFVDGENIEKYKGVGPKVANCIKLFSLRKHDSFPIDTWMEKIMGKLYGLESKKEMERFAREHFGKCGGYAQQYLFYYARSNDFNYTGSNVDTEDTL